MIGVERSSQGLENIEQEAIQGFEEVQSKGKRFKNQYHYKPNRRIAETGLSIGQEEGMAASKLLFIKSMLNAGLSRRTIKKVLKSHKEELETLRRQAGEQNTK